MRPTWGQVRQFCRRLGYRESRTDHFHYINVLPDRSTSGTMVSMGVDADEVPLQMWAMVWRHQLRLASEDEFWKGLRGEPVGAGRGGAFPIGGPPGGIDNCPSPRGGGQAPALPGLPEPRNRCNGDIHDN